MEKITKSLLALMLMLVSVVSAKADDAPKAPDLPAAPKASALVTDGTVEQYLYNVGAKGFLIGANDWGTRASIDAAKGYKVNMTLNADGQTYTFKNEAKGGNSMDCQGVDQIWVDGAGRAGDAQWTVTIAEDGTFKFGNKNVAGFLSVVPSKNDTKLYMSEASEAQNVWIAVSAADYATYQEAMTQYQNDYAQYEKDYAAWLKENYKVGDELVAISVPMKWEGASGTYGALGMAERYNGGSIAAGDVMTQTIDGLKNGKYNVTIEVAGSYTSGRGFECPTGDGLSVGFANAKEKNLPIVDRGGVGKDQVNVFKFKNVEVTDGTLKYGIKNVKDAGNWYIAKVSSIKMLPEPEAWFDPAKFVGKDYEDFTEEYVPGDDDGKKPSQMAWEQSPVKYKDGTIRYEKTQPEIAAARYEVDDMGNGYIEVKSNDKPVRNYDCQFFMQIPEDLRAKGTKMAINMKVWASADFNAEAQVHKEAGSWTPNAAPKVAFAKDTWKEITTFVTISEEGVQNYVLNLSDTDVSEASITFRIDDVSFEKADKDEWFFVTPITENGTSVSNGWKTETVGEGDEAKENGFYEIVSKASAANAWDTQAFIYIPLDARIVSKKVRLTAKIWADAEFSAAAQAHWAKDGSGYAGEFNKQAKFKANEWNDCEIIFEYPKNAPNWEPAAGRDGHAIADGEISYFVLNLCDTNGDKPSHTYRFDDVKIQRIDEEDWFVNNVIVAKDPTKEYEDGKAYDFPAAKYVSGEGPEAGYAEVVSKANPANAWASQVFFSIPASLAGKAVDITMYVKASKAVTADGQLHTNNKGDGYTNAAAPKMPFTTEWVKQTVTVEPTNQNTYVLNLANDAEAITYDFDSLAFALHPVDYKEPVLEETEQWYQDLAAQGIQLISRGEPGYTADAGDKSARYIKGDGTEGDYLEYVSKSGVSNTWESQVFIYLVDNKETTLPAGTEITVTMKVKASEAHNAGSQAQQGPGGYLGGGIPEIKFTTDWTPYTGSFTVPADGNSAKTNCFSLDLGNTGASNITYYFDEVVVTVEPPIKKEDVDWGDDNLVINGNLEGDDMSSFIGKIQKGHDEVKDGQPTGNYIYDEMDPEIIRLEAVDLKKNAKDEAEPKGLFLQVSKFAPDPADETKFKGVAWDSQLWIRLSKALPKGTVTLVEFDYKATNVSEIASQTHNEPGEWISNDCIGSITPSSEWQHFEFVGKIPADLRSIAFNLGTEAGGNYRFDNFVVKIAKDAKDAVDAATADADAKTLWAETLALNEAAHKGKTYDTEGYPDDLVKALADAVAAGKKALAPEEGDPAPTKESLSAATKDIEDAIAALEAAAPLADCDLTADMFFTWDAVDATAKTTGQPGCAYEINKSTGMPYGDGTVNEYNYADLSGFDHLAITATEGEPRLLFNRAAQDDHQGPLSVELPRDYGQNKYEAVVDNGDGSKTFVINLKEIVAKDGYAHLHAIKGANWANTTVTEMKLFVGESEYTDVLTAIEEVAEDAAVKDGKYFIDGQIVIVKNGVKYNAAGVVIQ